MTQRVAQLASLAIAPSSRRTYSSSERAYFDFCDQRGVCPLPATDVVLSYYAAHLTHSLQPSSVRVYISAIKNLHHELGMQFPSGPTTLLSRVMKGLSRLPEVSRTRLPITVPLLRQLCHRLSITSLWPVQDTVLLKAAFSVAFHGFFRCGELSSGLLLSDVEIHSESLSIRLRSSKTDSKGTTVVIGSSTDTAICPLELMNKYLEIRGLADGPLFLFKNGTTLTKQLISHYLRLLLPLCGVSSVDLYASHSFRIGAATSAAIAGVPEHVIRHMGRWKSDSVLRYIRIDNNEVIKVSRALANVQ